MRGGWIDASGVRCSAQHGAPRTGARSQGRENEEVCDVPTRAHGKASAARRGAALVSIPAPRRHLPARTTSGRYGSAATAARDGSPAAGAGAPERSPAVNVAWEMSNAERKDVSPRASSSASDNRRWATRHARVPRRITANVPTQASHAGARRARASACERLRVVCRSCLAARAARRTHESTRGARCEQREWRNEDTSRQRGAGRGAGEASRWS